MTRKTKEEKILEHSIEVVKTLTSESDSILEDEYKKLSSAYEKLLYRGNKVIKISDNIQSHIINKNESLEKDKVQILQYSKKKILNNITSQREIKEEYSNKMAKYLETIQSNKQKLESYKQDINEYKFNLNATHKKLDKAYKKLDTLERTKDELLSKINILKESQIPFDTILEKEIISSRKIDENLVFGILGLDNFTNIRNKLFEFTTEDGFILGITKYLQHSLKKTDTVIYFEAEIFYLIMPDTSMEEAIEKFKKLGKKRVIHGNSITLSGSLTYLTQEDTTDTIVERCFEKYNEIILNNEINIIRET